MKTYLANRIIIISMILLFYGTCFIPFSNPQSVNHYDEQSQKTTITGRILFSPMVSTKTYLIDSQGMLNHSWSSNYLPGESIRWLGNGTILRTIKTQLSGLGGEGGAVQKVTWDGTVIWEFSYNSSEYCSHHDIQPLQNGNILMIAWERKTPAEAIAAGRNPNYISSFGFYPDHIIEVQPTGPTNGSIVWEWHVWDHLIQDYDSSKANYGAVGDHPELVDINYRLSSERGWMHTNSIDYNEEFDQILISVRYYEEIWIIDHSTTTAEAAGHTGGNNGKGGDLLYRWGNPEAYRAGTASDKKFFNQHDATWIDKGCPGEGNILVFNNGQGRPAGAYSSIDEIVPPVNDTGAYYLEPGSTYGPKSLIWNYTSNPPSGFYSPSYSGAHRLKSGNTLICAGIGGNFFEVTSAGTTVWTYTNLYPARYANVFKIVYIPSDEELSNQPPYPPRNPAPANGSTDVSVDIELSWTGGDPDSDDNVYYDVYFGTSTTPPKISAGQSGTSFNLGRLSGSINYYWRIVTWDSNDVSTIGPLWDFMTVSEGNNIPPSTPTIIGDAKGSIQTSYDYTIQTTDPDQDDVKYYIDWGDDTTTLTGLNTSGQEIIVSHAWSVKGTYSVKVKAIDEYYTDSDWATLTVTMPCSYKPSNLGNILYVGGSGPRNYTKIQDAIDDTSNGDTVFVYDDSSPYNEMININKSIRLIGEDKNTTVINFNPNYPTSQIPILNINTDNCTIENLQITQSNNSVKTAGISINSNYNAIKNTIITNVANGINLSAYSESNTIIHNEIQNNQIGIVTIISTNNNISYNMLSNNSKYNIVLLTDSNNNNISFNILECSFYGIRIYGSQDNHVFKNCVRNNNVGLYTCCSARQNHFYNNNLLDNSQNAQENPDLLNIWYNYPNGPGNYWDDYNGSDENHDGIGDTPYDVPSAGNQDLYPLMSPYGMTNLTINFVPSPFKISISIKNTGSIPALNVHLLCTIDGGFLFCARKYSNVTTLLFPGQEVTRSTGFFGFGHIQITFSAEADNVPIIIKKIDGLLIGCFILIQ